jgi:hypothetical protein
MPASAASARSAVHFDTPEGSSSRRVSSQAHQTRLLAHQRDDQRAPVGRRSEVVDEPVGGPVVREVSAVSRVGVPVVGRHHVLTVRETVEEYDRRPQPADLRDDGAVGVRGDIATRERLAGADLLHQRPVMEHARPVETQPFGEGATGAKPTPRRDHDANPACPYLLDAARDRGAQLPARIERGAVEIQCHEPVAHAPPPAGPSGIRPRGLV